MSRSESDLLEDIANATAIRSHLRHGPPSQDSPDRPAPEPSPFERFQSLTKRLLHVSKDDLREAEKRRTA